MEYMSQEGYDELVAELQHMVNVELPAVRDAIAEARDKGDLSENFEYHAAKREQGKLLSRISFKQKVLENARVIDKSRLKSDTVGLPINSSRISRFLVPALRFRENPMHESHCSQAVQLRMPCHSCHCCIFREVYLRLLPVDSSFRQASLSG